MLANLAWHILISLTVFAAVFALVRGGWPWAAYWLNRQRQWYQHVLVQQLLVNVQPGTAVALAWGGVAVCGLLSAAIGGAWFWFVPGAAAGAFGPHLVVRHMEQKRSERLETQLIDGVTTLASGTRAGLNMVQSFELLVANSTGPIQQELAQLLREYEMGVDLGRAMHHAADRIGSSHYRLLFTALQMHRRRGGDVGQTLDSLAESIREIQRLEGKLDALTAQGRTQARMMAAMPIVLLAVIYFIDPDGVGALFLDPLGRVILACAVGLIPIAFGGINRNLAVDI